MCYDDENCEDYLDKYKNHPKLEIFKATEVDRTGQAFYNLYCNQLLDRVEKGWIMFLDDDDLLIDKNSLQDIEDLFFSLWLRWIVRMYILFCNILCPISFL